MPPNYNNKLNPKKDSSKSMWVSILSVVERVLKLIFKYTVLPWLFLYLGISWIYSMFFGFFFIIRKLIGILLNPIRLYRCVRGHIGADAKNDVSSSSTTTSAKKVDDLEIQLLLKEKENNTISLIQRFRLFFYLIEIKYLKIKPFLRVKQNFNKIINDIVNLPEKSDYIFDRYIKHSPFCVLNKLNPGGKKMEYSFNGIPITKYEGFEQYLNKRLTRFDVVEKNHDSVSAKPNTEFWMENMDDIEEINMSTISEKRVPTPYPILSNEQKSRVQNFLPSTRQPYLLSKQTQTNPQQHYIRKLEVPISRRVSLDSKFEPEIQNSVPKLVNEIELPQSLISNRQIVQIKRSMNERNKSGKTTVAKKKTPIVKLRIASSSDLKRRSEYSNFAATSKLENRKIVTSISPEDTDYLNQIKDSIRSVFPQKGYDDGSLAPIILRLAWHCSATYDKATGIGGSNGATMRFLPEITDEGNTGLDVARAALEPIKQRFPKITYSDLWTLAGKIAIEEMGGPQIVWQCGRVDCLDDRYVPPNGRLPFGYKDAHHIRETFERMGFNDQEAVALLGAHGLGRCHKRYSGWEGKWTSNPVLFSNEFYKLLLNEEWSLGTVPETGRQQYYNKDKSLMMLNTDLELIRDPIFLQWVKLYSENEQRFFDDFAKTFSKLLELGITRDQQGKILPKPWL